MPSASIFQPRRTVLPVLPALIAFLLALALALAVPASAEETAVLWQYDLSGLLDQVRDCPPPELDAPVIDRGPGTATSASAPSGPSTLDGFLRQHFAPGMAAQLSEQSELRDGHTLALTATPLVHEHVAHVLAALRQLSRLQVRVSWALIMMSPQVRQARFAMPDLGWKPLPGQPGLMFAELARSEGCTVIKTVLMNDDEIDGRQVMSRITAFAGQLTHAPFQDQRAFLPLPFTGVANNHPTAMLHLGDRASVRATPSADRLFIDLTFEHTRRALLEMKAIDLGAAGKAEEPVTWSGGERITRSIPVGDILIITTGIYLDAELPRAGFLVIEPEIIIEPDHVTIP